MRLHAEVDGPPDGAPVVFLHGASGSMRTYAWLPGEITEGRRIVRLDLRGHGDSEHAPGPTRSSATARTSSARCARPWAGPRCWSGTRSVASSPGGWPSATRARRGRVPRGPAAVHGRGRGARGQRRRADLPRHPRRRRALARGGHDGRAGRRRAGGPRPAARAARSATTCPARAPRRGCAWTPASSRARSTARRSPPPTPPRRCGAGLPARRRRHGLGVRRAPRRAPGDHATPTWRSSASRRRPRHPRRARAPRRLRRGARALPRHARVASVRTAISPGTRPCARRGAPRAQASACARAGTSGTARRTDRVPSPCRCGRRCRSRARRR